jgi:hypothetical protein
MVRMALRGIGDCDCGSGRRGLEVSCRIGERVMLVGDHPAAVALLEADGESEAELRGGELLLVGGAVQQRPGEGHVRAGRHPEQRGADNQCRIATDNLIALLNERRADARTGAPGQLLCRKAEVSPCAPARRPSDRGPDAGACARLPGGCRGLRKAPDERPTQALAGLFVPGP